uniref:hematopoietic cell signal transducer isoform X3 n=1 Tax=Jaculus jaculus TaxID=51337 RepID=UPI001E1B375F|nr:hematopoietic cell signal transducer isoform X3 [Jaculus jaculus]
MSGPQYLTRFLQLQPSMASPTHLLLFLLLLAAATAHTSPGSCSGCGPLQLLVGLVAADAVMSLLIVGVVYACMGPRHRPTPEDGIIYINMPSRG